MTILKHFSEVFPQSKGELHSASFYYPDPTCSFTSPRPCPCNQGGESDTKLDPLPCSSKGTNILALVLQWGLLLKLLIFNPLGLVTDLLANRKP